ncbi:uncharacterized protein BDW70DRAFT_160202 [Aspergillus foveolatus]|uniref:uncharacterized protein n=1 Tax=Aspergillus foveolatus TaxID=210207 RepID=UPI003CCD1FEC
MSKESAISDSDLDIGDFPPFSTNSLSPETPLIEVDMDASDHGSQCPCTLNAPSQVMTVSPATCKRGRCTSDLEDEGGSHEDEPVAVRFCGQKRDAANIKSRAKARAISHNDSRPIKLNLSIYPILPGITAGNLQIPPPGTTSKTIRFYLLCLVLRRLDWHMLHAPTPATPESKRWVGDTADLDAAFVQTRGIIAKRPCAGCSINMTITPVNKAPNLSEMASTLRYCNKFMPNEQHIPFVIGDEMLGSITQLRRAEQDLLGHMERIQTRIAELEEKRRERPKL